MQSHKVRPRKYVISSNKYPQVRDENVLQASDDRCRQWRIVKSAEHRAVHKQESHDAGEEEGD